MEVISVTPRIYEGIPYCDDTCPEHDGKRCRLLGLQPGNICEPAVVELVAEKHRLQNHVPGLTATLDETRAEAERLRAALRDAVEDWSEQAAADDGAGTAFCDGAAAAYRGCISDARAALGEVET
jgi:hypothetical protein